MMFPAPPRKTILFLALLLFATACRTYYIGSNPASMLKNEKQARGIDLQSSSDTSLNGLLYHLDYGNDYQLDPILKADVRNLKGFTRFAVGRMLSTGKVLINYKKLKVGCTAFTARTADGDVLYARNFDFTADGPSPVVITRTAPEQGYASTSIVGLALLKYPRGCLSDSVTDVSLLAVAPYLLMDGINEKGLAISVLYLDAKDTLTGKWYGGTAQYDRHKHDIMTTTAMRLVLDRAADVEEALALLNQYNMFANGKAPDCSYHFLLADRTGRSVVLEYVHRNGQWVASPVDARLVTNFYLHPEMYGIGHGHDRYEKADKSLIDNKFVLSEEEAMNLLEEVSQTRTAAKTSNTQWSVVYNLTRGTFSICAGRKYDTVVTGKVGRE